MLAEAILDKARQHGYTASYWTPERKKYARALSRIGLCRDAPQYYYNRSRIALPQGRNLTGGTQQLEPGTQQGFRHCNGTTCAGVTHLELARRFTLAKDLASLIRIE